MVFEVVQPKQIILYPTSPLPPSPAPLLSHPLLFVDPGGGPPPPLPPPSPVGIFVEIWAMILLVWPSVLLPVGLEPTTYGS